MVHLTNGHIGATLAEVLHVPQWKSDAPHTDALLGPSTHRACLQVIRAFVRYRIQLWPTQQGKRPAYAASRCSADNAFPACLSSNVEVELS